MSDQWLRAGESVHSLYAASRAKVTSVSRWARVDSDAGAGDNLIRSQVQSRPAGPAPGCRVGPSAAVRLTDRGHIRLAVPGADVTVAAEAGTRESVRG